MALIRYPGSKEKLVPEIRSRFPDAMKYQLWSIQMGWEYREPFFGAGAVGFKVIRNLSHRCGVWLNDADPGMVALWSSVRDDRDGLLQLVDIFEPSAALFYQFKNEDGRTDLPATMIGFRKLALHQMSYSGLGFKAGGPLGGKDQDNAKYPVDCRWNRERACQEIVMRHKMMKRFQRPIRITCGDFSRLIEGAPEQCFIYADPPYYEKGPELYKHSMSDEDHARLAELLRDCRASWVLSYDDHPFIRNLYSWAHIEPIHITYTTAMQVGGVRPKNQEVLITPAPVEALV